MVNSQYSWLDAATERIASRIINLEHPIVEDDLLDILERHLESVYTIVDVLLNDKNANSEDPCPKQQARLVMICEILGLVHFAIEQNRQWAINFSTEFQRHLARVAFRPETGTALIQHLLDILHQSDLPIIEEIETANAWLLENNEKPLYDDSLLDISQLLKQIAALSSGCVFELYDSLVSQTNKVIPLDIQRVMIAEMMLSNVPIIQETVVLMLLHPDVAIRRYVGGQLIHHLDVVSPCSLRRLIAMRNWLPHSEKPAVDRLIKAARQYGVDCEPWPQSEVIQVTATNFDGIGSQSIIALSKQRQHYFLSGLLLKEHSGIREPLLMRSKQLSELNCIIRDMAHGSPTLHVDIQYLDIIVPQFITINLHHGNPPPALLMGLAEALGCTQWQADRLTTHNLLSELAQDFGEMPLDIAINHALLASSHWLTNDSFAQSWFECDASAENSIVDMMHNNDVDAKFDVKVVNEILEPRREKWERRLIWMAYWAKAAQKQPRPDWKLFYLIAKLLHDGMPMQDIPLMQAIAKETIHSAINNTVYPLHGHD